MLLSQQNIKGIKVRVRFSEQKREQTEVKASIFALPKGTTMSGTLLFFSFSEEI